MPFQPRGRDKEQLRRSIEELREAIHQSYSEQGGEFSSEKILRLSRKLDRLMNELHLIEQRTREGKKTNDGDNDNDGASF